MHTIGDMNSELPTPLKKSKVGRKRKHDKSLSDAEIARINRRRLADRMAEIGAQKLMPFIPSVLEGQVKAFASRFQKTPPVIMGGITSLYLDKPESELRSVLLEYVDTSETREIIQLKDDPGNTYRRHYERRKLAGDKRKTMYLHNDDAQKLEEIVQTYGLSNYGRVVVAILEDFFSRDISEDAKMEIIERCVDI